MQLEKAYYQNLFEQTNDAVFILDLNGTHIDVNKRASEMLAYSYDELINLSYKDISFEVNKSKQFLKKLYKVKLLPVYERKFIKKSGEIIVVELNVQMIKDEKGNPLYIQSVARDITRRKEAEAALKISEEKYTAIFDESPIAIKLYNSKGFLTHANTACLELFNVSSIEGLLNLKLFNDLNITESIKADLMKNQYVKYETVFNFDCLQGQEQNTIQPCSSKYLSITIKSVLYNKVIDGYIVQILDISEQKKAQEEIKYLSYHDKLTGLYNRRFYEESFLTLDIKENLPFSIIMADVNGLKLFNDSFGHTKGDELIIKTADILKKVCPNKGTIARLGGDEFVLLLPQTDSLDAEKITKHIHSLASEETLNSIKISIALGCDTKNYLSENLIDIFKKAENHMYTNKVHDKEQTQNKLIHSIMHTLYQRNEEERLTSEKVSKLSEAIANHMLLAPKLVEEIRVAGLMHNIGIIGIADKFIDLTSKKEGREQLSQEKALEEIQRCSGTQFDPTIVKAITELLLNKEIE